MTCMCTSLLLLIWHGCLASYSVLLFLITIISLYVHVHVGVILGDPHGENKFISHPTVRQRDIRAAEAMCGDGKKFFLSALDIFFTKSTLARSLVTKKEGRDQLDPDIIEGLRCKLIKFSSHCVI